MKDVTTLNIKHILKVGYKFIFKVYINKNATKDKLTNIYPNSTFTQNVSSIRISDR